MENPPRVERVELLPSRAPRGASSKKASTLTHIETIGGRPITVDRTPLGGVRVFRRIGQNHGAYLIFDVADVPRVARAILEFVEADRAGLITSLTLQSGPLVIDRAGGYLRLSRPDGRKEPWLSMTDATACDVALAMLSELEQ